MKKENVIYLSNECIQLVVGCDDHRDMVKIYNYKRYSLSEGAIINGVITDEFEIKSVLKRLSEEGYHELNLVIDSSQIISKSITIPKMKKEQIYNVIKDELSSLNENSEELVYDYAYLSPSEESKKAMRILCCAVDRKLIAGYLELFEECNIKIKAIDFSINILGKLVKELVHTDDGSYLVSMLDGSNLTSVLFEHNSYKLSYRSRIVSSRDTVMFEQEVVSNISNIVQFSKSGENSLPIKNVYFCGLHEEEETVLKRIRENIKIHAEIFPEPASIYVVNKKENFKLDHYILPVGYLLKK